MKLRRATSAEGAWINDRYAEVQFRPSNLEEELVVVADIGGEPAGIGRLVPVDEGACELGGMLVFERFRGRGVARAIVDELLRHAGAREVYCIPFARLEELYAAAGFRRTEAGPEKVMEKVAWCRETYDEPVVLMKTQAHQR